MIAQNLVRDIIEISRIEEVVSDFVTIKKRGANYVGLCPFHNEKTPSFHVSPSKGIFKCFGCGKSGNVVGFIMDHERYSFTEAIEFLAGKYHIEIEQKEPTAEELKEERLRESLFNIHEFAANYYVDNLHNSNEGKSIGLTYLAEREFHINTIRHFKVGYSSSDPKAFTNHAIKNGYNLEVLIKSGLTIEKGTDVFDRFKGRIVFPIQNLSGKVIAFGGRALSNDTSVAKYINSPETDIYNKSKALYGINHAKTGISTNGLCYLVEGYTDVMSMVQSGIKNVVGSSGTSLTVDQIRLIKRFTQNITILYDGDEAGLKAAFRGIDLVLEEGLNVKIVVFPPGEDPDSFARKNRPVEVRNYLQTNARDFIRLKSSLLLESAKDDPAKRSALIKEIMNSVALIPDIVYRSVYVKECASLLNIAEETLISELNRILRQRFRKTHGITEEFIRDVGEEKVSGQNEIVETKHSNDYQERNLIRMLLLYGNKNMPIEITNEFDKQETVNVNISQFIVNELVNDGIALENIDYQKVFDVYVSAFRKEELPQESDLIYNSDEKIRNIAFDLLSNPHQLSENWERYRVFVKTEEDIIATAVVNTVLVVKERRIKSTILELQKELQTCTNEERSIEIIRLIQKHKKKLNHINKVLGRVIIS